MNCAKLMPLFAAVLAVLSVATVTGDDGTISTEDATPVSLGEQVKGEWVQYRDTPNGRYMTIKEHTGRHTVLTTYDPNKVAIHSHRSEYDIDDSGSANVFRYRNRTVLIGPNAGEKQERENAYLFRIENDQFIEVHGMMKDDSGKPSLTIWERLKNNPIPEPQS